jgi:hypothetical protein
MIQASFVLKGHYGFKGDVERQTTENEQVMVITQMVLIVQIQCKSKWTKTAD